MMEKGKVADYGILNSWKFEQLMRFFFFFSARPRIIRKQQLAKSITLLSEYF